MSRKTTAPGIRETGYRQTSIIRAIVRLYVMTRQEALGEALHVLKTQKINAASDKIWGSCGQVLKGPILVYQSEPYGIMEIK